MKKLKNLDYLLSLGLFILCLAVYSIALNEVVLNEFFKCLIIFIFAVMSYSLSFLFKRILNVDISSKVAYALGSIGVVNTFIALGVYKILGSWFSPFGSGVAIFLASICIIIGILAIITAILYKNYNFIHLAFLAVLGMVVSLLVHFKVDYYYLIIGLIVVLFIISLFKSKKLTFEFSIVGLLVLSILGVFAQEKGIVLSSILFFVSVISIIRVLLTKKGFEYELLSIITLSIVVTMFTMSTPDMMRENLAVIISVGIVLILDLALSTLRAVDSKFVKISYKVVSLILLLIIVMSSTFNNIAHLIAIAFILITSVVNTFAIHNDDYEKYFLPFKIIFISYYFIEVMGSDAYTPIAYSIQAILFAIVYRVFNKQSAKPLFMIAIALSLLLAASYMEDSLITNVIAIVSLFSVYFIFRNKNDDVTTNVLYYILLFVMIGMESTNSFLEVLVLILSLGISTFIHRNNKVCFAGSLLILTWFMEDFLSLAIKSYDVFVILSNLMRFLMFGIAAEVLFDKNIKAKNVFSGIIFTFGFLLLLGNADSFLTYIFALIVALVMILVSLKSKGYKSLYSIGFIFSIIYLLELLGPFDDIPSSVYLLIISIAVIVVSSIMIYKFNKNKDLILEEKVIVNKKAEIKDNNINYCPECGKKVFSNDIYCSECGNKVRWRNEEKE